MISTELEHLTANRVANFFPGPGALPLPVLKRIHSELFNFNGTGMSVMEISHRSPVIQNIIDDSADRIKRLTKTDDQFEVIFLQGGGSLQFLMVPMNFSQPSDCIDYIDTGYWTEKAIRAGQSLDRDLKIIASSAESNHTALPDLNKVKARSEAKYLHLCSNNTVVGTQFKAFPDMGVPVVVDMSSDFMSQVTNLDNIDCAYAHAQKNVGLSGVTVVMIRKKMLENITEGLPELFDYRTHVSRHSNYHTPPCFSIYVTWLILKWIEEDIGGLENLEQINRKKASLLYEIIDDNDLYHCAVQKADRSQMNVVFSMDNTPLEQQFIQDAKKAGIVGVAGHRTRTGCRVSLYNGVSLQSVSTLVDFMHTFSKQHATKALASV